MLLIEAADFIDYSTTKESEAIKNDEVFESANSSPINNPNYDTDSPDREKFSTPITIHYEFDSSCEGTQSPIYSKPNSKFKFTKLKKTHAFLSDSNKQLGFYDILFMKLAENLCLIMVKSSRLNKYCHLMSDFSKIVWQFLEFINRKRVELSDEEINNNTAESGRSSMTSPSPSITKNTS